MPGVDLNLDLPSLADSMATIVAKLVTALSTIETDLTPKITSSEININAALSMNGSALTNAGSVQFLSGNIPTAQGSIYYSGGEFYAIDSAGVIQLTAAGSLNAGAIGSIVGDYGGLNGARVTYNDASGEYRFTQDPGVWANLVADDLVLESSTGGSVRFGVDAAITTARQFQIKSLPTSGVSMLVYNAATSTVEDGGVTAVTAMSVATLTVTNPVKHGDFQKTFAMLPAITSGTYTLLGSNSFWINLNTGSLVYERALELEVGERLKTLKVLGSGTATITVSRHSDPAVGASETKSGAIGTTITMGGTYVSGDVYRITATFTGAGGDNAKGILATYDRP